MFFISLILLEIYIFSAHCYNYDPSLYVPKYYDFIDAQTRLRKDLFAEYDPMVAPVYTRLNYTLPIGYDKDAPEPFNYTLFLYYLKLVEIQEPAEKVSVVLELGENWYDLRLAWNASEYSGNNELYLRQSEVWSPTLTAFGVSEMSDFRDQDFRMVSITDRGLVSTAVTVKISANCAIDVANFPFDTQTCQVEFCLPYFNSKAVKMYNTIYEGILTEKVIATMGNSEWFIKKLSGRVEKLQYNDNFGDLELSIFEIEIRRSPVYYMYMIVFPSFIINVVSIVGCFMKKADAISRLNIGLTNIMTMTFILGVMADQIPKTGKIPLLGIYLIINLGIMMIAIFVNVFLPKFKKWMLVKLKSNNSRSILQKFIGTGLDYTFAIILELATIGNFIFVVSYWAAN